MQQICQTVYEPLFTFCDPLHSVFPELTPGFDRLVENRQSKGWGLIRELGPGCTKELLVSCISRDESKFFVDSTNPFVAFIGGKVLYDRLDETEREDFWGKNHLINIIRQCMVLHALEPLTTKLQCIVSKITDATKGQQMNQTSLMSMLMTDPEIISGLFGLMDSPESMKTLISSLRKIVDGMTTEAPEEVQSEDEEDVTNDTSEGSHSTTLATTDAIESSATSEVVETIDAIVSPGMFLKKNRKKQKAKQRNQKNTRTATGGGPNDLSALLSMLGDVQMDEADMLEISSDLKSMDPVEFTTIAKEGLSSIMGNGESSGILSGIQTMMSVLSPNSGLGDISEIAGMAGVSGMSGMAEILKVLSSSTSVDKYKKTGKNDANAHIHT